MALALNNEVTRRRRCAICCYQAQANFRSRVDQFLSFLIEAIGTIPLQAAFIPVGFIRPSYPIPVRLPTVPVRIPKIAEPFPIPGAGDILLPSPTFQPETQTMELSQADVSIITQIATQVTSMKSAFDCVDCCKKLAQDNIRKTEVCIDDEGEEFCRRVRVPGEKVVD